MSSYSEWITARGTEYAEAITEAYDNREGTPTEGTYAWAWQQLSNDSDINGFLPTGSTAFWTSGGPTAGENEILKVGKFLTDNPTVAAALNLAVQVIVDSGAQTDLDTTTVVGGEYRQWKGQKVYTFPNGIIVGKDSKLIASFGQDVAAATQLGEDTLIFFDGIPGSKGTTTAGTTVFNGDMVVSGSIQGAGGIVIIDDVIQLEQGVNNPAGIAVNDEGKILLRHRGLGFLDFVDEDERMRDEAIDEGKLWVGTQNTNSSRWGTTLIPNGNFSLVTAVSESGNVVEYPSGALTIGSTDREVGFLVNGETVDYGVVSFDGSGGTGFIMPAVPIEAERYVINIRIASSSTEIDASTLHPTYGDSFGLYLFFFETSDSDLGAYEHIHHLGSTITGTDTIQSGVTVHSSNTQENRINQGVGNDLGSSLTQSWDVLSFTYTPTKVDGGFQTKNASFGVYVKNVNEDVYLDYVVMTAKPPLASEIADDIAGVETGITNETGSLVPDAAFPTINLWTDFPIGTGAIELLPTGGDAQPATPDSACRVNFASLHADGFNGLLSHAIQRDHDKYIVGARVYCSAECDIEIVIVEETLGQFNAFSNTWYISPSVALANTSDITTVSGVGALDLDDPSSGETHTIAATTWTNLFGTYIPTGLDVSSHESNTAPTTNVGRFSVFINVKTAGVDVDVDYVWCSKQTASGDLAEALADYAFGTAKAFVTDMNDQLVKESGSIITNASMSMLGSNNLPSGYLAYNGTMTLVETGTPVSDRAIQIVKDGGSDCALYTPSFQMDEADKFSIGVRAKSTDGTGRIISVSIVWSDTPLDDGELTLVDNGKQPSGSNFQTSTNIDNLEIDPNDNQGGSTVYDVELSGGAYENILATWTKPATAKVASVMIKTTTGVIVDYVLVKEQTCSFDLAKETAEEKRDEAIAQATGALQGFTNSLNQEQGSLLANSTFASYVYDDPIQKPKNWVVTRSNGTFARVVSSTEATNDSEGDPIPVPGENVQSLGLLGGGAILTHTGTSTVGLLSSYFSLPSTVGIGDVVVDSETVSPTGKYMVAIQYKSLNASHTSGLRILAHESKTIPTTPHLLVTSSAESAFDSGTTVASSYATGYTGDSLTEDNTDVQTKKIQIITLSDDTDETVGEGGDEFIEEWTDTSFHSIGGTYTPSAGMRYVCFEFIFETNKNAQEHAIDYITMTPQTVDADFAETLAIARSEDLIDNLEEEPPQRGNLIENPFFTSAIKRTRSTKNYPKKWVPYSTTAGIDFSQFEFENTVLNRGLKMKGYSDGTYWSYPGAISMPFRTTAPDYEITLRIKRNSSADNDIAFVVIAEEYDSDIEDDIIAISYDPPNRVPASVASVVQQRTRGKTLTSVHDDNLVERSDGVAVERTVSSNYIDLFHDTYKTYKIQYIPTDTCRYASIKILTMNENTEGFSIAMVKCVVDTGATYSRKLGPWFGQGLLDIDLNSFLDGDDIRGRVTANDGKVSYTDGAVLTYLEGLDASDKSSGVFGLIAANTAKDGFPGFHEDGKRVIGQNFPGKGDIGLGNVEDKTPAQLAALAAFTGAFGSKSDVDANNLKVGWANQVTQYDDTLARSAAASMGLLDFTNFGSRVKGVTQYKSVNPYRNFCANGDFKLMTDSDAYIDDQSVDQGIYPTGCWFGSTNFGTTPNDADGDDGGSQLGSFKGATYSSNTQAGKSLKYTGGYDSSNISHTPPSWYFPHINEDADGNYINLAAFGHGITFSSQKISGGAKVKVKFQAKCAVRLTGATKASFYVGSSEDGLNIRAMKWMYLPNSIEGALTVTVQGYSNEEDKDFYVATSTNAECPANRSASVRTVDGNTDEYIAQKTVTVTSTSWATYSAEFQIPDDLEAFSVSIGRKANWTSDEFLTACPTWQHDEAPLGYTGNGSSAFTTYTEKGESWYGSYLDAATDTNRTTGTHNASYPYGSGWEVADINSRLISHGGGVQFDYDGTTADWPSTGINNDANYISLRGVECKEVSGLTLSAMVTLKTTSYSVGSGGFLALLDSDAEFKQDIEPATNALEVINELPVSRFRWKPREGEGPENMEDIPKSWGMIAQDVENIHETFVGRSKRTSGIKLGLRADEIIALSVKAIQEQQQVIESQQTQIDDLKEMVQNLINKDNDSDESPEET